MFGARGVRRVGTADHALGEEKCGTIPSRETGDHSSSSIFDETELSAESAAVSVSVKSLIAG